jgi:hypothetical protein
MQFNIKGGIQYQFTSINRDEYQNLFDFFRHKNLNILNANQNAISVSERGRVRKEAMGDDPYLAQLDAETRAALDSEEDDDDYVAPNKSESEEESSGDEVPEDAGSDDEKTEKKKKPKKKKEDDGKSKKKKKDKKDKKKKKKGPKKPRDAFHFFSKERKHKLKEEHADKSSSDIKTLLKEEWEKLDEAAKAPYEDKAKADEKRYEEEKANQSEDKMDVDSGGDSGGEEAGSPKKKSKRGRKKKRPGEPKKPLSAYMIWSVKKMPEYKAKNPEMDFSELSKLLGAEWKKLDAAEKSEVEDLAMKEKERYKQEMETYEEKIAKGEIIIPDDDDEEAPKNEKKKDKSEKSPKKAKKPAASPEKKKKDKDKDVQMADASKPAKSSAAADNKIKIKNPTSTSSSSSNAAKPATSKPDASKQSGVAPMQTS